ncbi:hypothetical protein UFOVP45_42 [uncultured Caudovirales phage]|uniref:Uncharacterized protein n=1 Tax=uncultured Caudovirales phage TaxID=2100421 RepID=A0A6J5KUH2_9CAUD|nr:hypothetical protein UFOVP45_42 [uncultured Caudovirales phage]
MTAFQDLLNDINQFGRGGTSIYGSTAKTQAEALAQDNTRTAQLAQLNSDLASLNNQFNATTALINSYTAALVGLSPTSSQAIQLKADRQTQENLQAQLISAKSLVNSNIKILKSGKSLNTSYFAKVDAAAASAPLSQIVKPGFTKIKYNVGSVKEAYFQGTESFMKEITPRPGNTPKVVNTAAELWASGAANKGMIQTWTPPGGGDVIKRKDPAGTNVTTVTNNSTAVPNSAFQFQYNPTNVSMTYSGTPSVDIAYEASGNDKFNFVGTGTTQSTIGFQILINRVYDMKYYGTNGVLKNPSYGNLYSPVAPTYEDQRNIYNKGTMYDIEYLLRTLLGLTMPSYLRGEQTADMGFVAAVPVELHLGQGMRYLVWINQLSINHVLFNERMVPLFTTVDISCQRMPDFGTASSQADTPTTASGLTVTPNANGKGSVVYNPADGSYWNSPNANGSYGGGTSAPAKTEG